MSPGNTLIFNDLIYLHAITNRKSLYWSLQWQILTFDFKFTKKYKFLTTTLIIVVYNIEGKLHLVIVTFYKTKFSIEYLMIIKSDFVRITCKI